MYSLEINFLNDRAERTQEAPKPTPPPGVGAGAMLPVIAGVIVGLALPAGVFTLKLYREQQGKDLTAEKEQLTGELTRLQSQLQQAAQLRDQATQVNADVEALVGVFSGVQPISAVIQEVSNRMPGNVQMSAFSVTENSVDIKGTAINYAAINDFLLVLKQSPFLEPTEIRLTASTVKETNTFFQVIPVTQDATGNPVDPARLPQVTVNLPYVVDYAITAKLSNPSALDPEILDQLRALGALGLVNRLEVLQQMGVIQP